MTSGNDRRDTDRHDKGGREARRILDHVAQESAPGGAPLLGRATRGVRDHIAAADVDPGDRIEYWGTRIGRALGLLIVVALMAWLVLLLLDLG